MQIAALELVLYATDMARSSLSWELVVYRKINRKTFYGGCKPAAISFIHSEESEDDQSLDEDACAG